MRGIVGTKSFIETKGTKIDYSDSLLINAQTHLIRASVCLNGISIGKEDAKSLLEITKEIEAILENSFNDKAMCPKCGGELVLLPSTDQRMCSNGSCCALYDWKLKDGEVSPWIDKKVGGV